VTLIIENKLQDFLEVAGLALFISFSKSKDLICEQPNAQKLFNETFYPFIPKNKGSGTVTECLW
jgi:hypothetical protein